MQIKELLPKELYELDTAEEDLMETSCDNKAC